LRPVPFIRHIPFLRAVLLYACTAFGGPLGHLGMMTKTFVQRRRDVTAAELAEYNAFCQMLPGPSSTQTVALIALKRGGIPLALATLGIWILPATIIMGAASFLVAYVDAGEAQKNLFLYVQPMSVGFIAYAAVRMTRASVRSPITWAVMVVAFAATAVFHSPWVFPAVLIAAGAVTNISNRRIPDPPGARRPIRWSVLSLYAGIFVAAGALSEAARVYGWAGRRLFNLFENFYRFGSIVFGGGQALLPMMLYQFVQRPVRQGGAAWLGADQLLTGYGLVQAVPGPVFSICTYVGGLTMHADGPVAQVAGCVVATVGVFLPSTLLLLFLFPLYQNLKQHAAVYRALEGIHAAIAGIVWASGAVLFGSVAFGWMNAVVVLITFCVLQFTKIPAPLVVVGWLLLGWAHAFG